MIGTSSGSLKLVDLKKNKVVWREALNSLIFDLDWNSNGIVAVASTQSMLHLRHFSSGEFTKMTSIGMDSSLRCVAFCPSNQNWLAVGLFNGNVVI